MWGFYEYVRWFSFKKKEFPNFFLIFIFIYDIKHTNEKLAQFLAVTLCLCPQARHFTIICSSSPKCINGNCNGWDINPWVPNGQSGLCSPQGVQKVSGIVNNDHG